MGNIGWVQLLIVLVIVVLLFGTKKLKGIGSDLGGAIKGFKKAVSEEDADFKEPQSKVEEKPGHPQVADTYRLAMQVP